MPIERSAIDEARFGVRTAKAVARTADEVQQAVAACERQGVQLLLLRLPTDAHAAVHAAEQAGALLTDTLCFYARAVDALTEPPPPRPGLHLRAGDAADADRVEALARAAFAGYPGHYRNDPRLQAVDVDEVYPSWARACCVRATGPLVLAEFDAQPAAFAALRPGGDGELDVALLAVHPQFRQLGVAADLLRHLSSGALGPAVSRLSYSTQITNVAMQRLLARLGFLPTGSHYTFHWWARGGRT